MQFELVQSCDFAGWSELGRSCLCVWMFCIYFHAPRGFIASQDRKNCNTATFSFHSVSFSSAALQIHRLAWLIDLYFFKKSLSSLLSMCGSHSRTSNLSLKLVQKAWSTPGFLPDTTPMHPFQRWNYIFEKRRKRMADSKKLAPEQVRP